MPDANEIPFNTNQAIDFARLTLNYKEIPYRTVWLEYPEIEELAISLGAEPTTTLPNGDQLYTLPMIHDLSTGAVVNDSAKIAQYLDEQYPETPRVLAPGTHGLYQAFLETFMNNILSPTWSFVMPYFPNILNPPSLEYYRKAREPRFGKTLEGMRPDTEEGKEEQWRKVEAAFGRMAKWMPKDSLFIMGGDKPTFPDFAIGAALIGYELTFGEEGEEWKIMSKFDDGRWARTLRAWDKYRDVSK
ncbi:hypothetical protein C8J56DRAFT_1159586 [Mycena floridula]|nr:hypothetical protein C8J56DRAFT_1159586 [Mycena floridula]